MDLAPEADDSEAHLTVLAEPLMAERQSLVWLDRLLPRAAALSRPRSVVVAVATHGWNARILDLLNLQDKGGMGTGSNKLEHTTAQGVPTANIANDKLRPQQQPQQQPQQPQINLRFQVGVKSKGLRGTGGSFIASRT